MLGAPRREQECRSACETTVTSLPCAFCVRTVSWLDTGTVACRYRLQRFASQWASEIMTEACE